MRSVWKGKYHFKVSRSRPSSTFGFRNSYVMVSDLGKRFTLSNGKRLILFCPKLDMVGSKFGSFVLTKKLGSSIHSRKLLKKK